MENSDEYLTKFATEVPFAIETVANEATDTGPEALAHLVEWVIATEPVDRCGVLFAAKPREFYAKQLGGCSVRTVERWFKDPRFHTEAAFVDDKRVKLARVLAPGETPKLTAATVANQMRRVWLGRKINQTAIDEAAEAGTPWKTDDLAIRLAEVWPDGQQVAILKNTLANWSGFMAVKGAMDEAAQDAFTGDTNLPVKKMFFKFPRLEPMRARPEAAVALHEMDLQAKAGKGKP
jgi:hypothetical protein